MADLNAHASSPDDGPLGPRVIQETAPPAPWLTKERIIIFAVLFVFLAIWEVTGRRVGTFFLPPPSSLINASQELLSSGELFREIGKSTQTLILGYVMAAVVGVSLGFIFGWYRFLGEVANPFINALYVVPVSALVPLVIIWFGLGLFPRILVVFLFCVFEILISTLNGVGNVERGLVEAARSFGVRSQWDMFRKIVFFNALPFVFTGLRIGASRAVKGMIIGELLFAVTGLGGLIVKYSSAYRTDVVFVVIVVITIFGVVVNDLVQRMHKRLAPWND